MNVHHYRHNLTLYNGGVCPCDRHSCPGPSRTGRWDPATLLGLNNPQYSGGGISCVGWAPSRGRRCQWTLDTPDVTGALALLRGLTGQPADQALASGQLQRAARMLLCHHHQDKDCPRIVDEWATEITSWCRDHRPVQQGAATSSDGGASRSAAPASPGGLFTNRASPSLFGDLVPPPVPVAAHSFSFTSPASLGALGELPDNRSNSGSVSSAPSPSPAASAAAHPIMVFTAAAAAAGPSVVAPPPPPAPASASSAATVTTMLLRSASRQSEARAPATQASRNALQKLPERAARLPTPPLLVDASTSVQIAPASPPSPSPSPDAPAATRLPAPTKPAAGSAAGPPTPPATPSPSRRGDEHSSIRPQQGEDELRALRESNARLEALLARTAAQLARSERLCQALEGERGQQQGGDAGRNGNGSGGNGSGGSSSSSSNSNNTNSEVSEDAVVAGPAEGDRRAQRRRVGRNAQQQQQRQQDEAAERVGEVGQGGASGTSARRGGRAETPAAAHGEQEPAPRRSPRRSWWSLLFGGSGSSAGSSAGSRTGSDMSEKR